MTASKLWIAELMKKMISFGVGGDDPTFVKHDTWLIFVDYIQKGQYDKINGNEPGYMIISQTGLKKCRLLRFGYTESIMA